MTLTQRVIRCDDLGVLLKENLAVQVWVLIPWFSLISIAGADASGLGTRDGACVVTGQSRVRVLSQVVGIESLFEFGCLLGRVEAPVTSAKFKKASYELF